MPQKQKELPFSVVREPSAITTPLKHLVNIKLQTNGFFAFTLLSALCVEW